MVEYGVILLAVAIAGIGALSMYGHNIGDIFATTSAILPGSEPIYDQPVYVGNLVELDVPNPIDGSGVSVDVSTLAANNADPSPIYRLDQNISQGEFGVAWESLVVERY
ncbi:MAG: hypothetical protein SF028_05340 [Candidatus Sumerlaeia bacterium]|nr:hypothetical protein [Candidatus Sumerlaeia bacterium]